MTGAARSGRVGSGAAGVAVLLCALACGAPRRADIAPPVAHGVFAGPYLLLAAPGSAVVAFIAGDLEDPPLVEWSSASGSAGGEQAIRSDDVWYAVLDGLPAGEVVTYRVRTARGVGRLLRFRVGPEPDESFRFAVYGETQKGGQVHQQVAAALGRERIDFLVHTGDLVHRSDERSEWLEFFELERDLLAQTPVMVCAGDRDAGKLELFRRYFLHRVWNDNRRYYARDWGNLRLIFVDINADLTFGTPQYALIEAALEEGARTGKLMAMVVHYPPYSSASPGAHDVREPIHTLARDFGVELVLSGHSLNYERTDPQDGVTYVVSGGGGARSRPISPDRFSAAVSTEPHYVLIDVDAESLAIRAVTVGGDTVDHHTIRALAPRTSAGAATGN